MRSLDVSSGISRTFVGLHSDSGELSSVGEHRFTLRLGRSGRSGKSSDNGERVEWRCSSESTFSESSGELRGELGGRSVENL